MNINKTVNLIKKLYFILIVFLLFTRNFISSVEANYMTFNNTYDGSSKINELTEMDSVQSKSTLIQPDQNALPGIKRFGYYSSYDPNTKLLAIGCPHCSPEGVTYAGAVMIYKLIDGQTILQTIVTADELQNGAQFGTSLKLNGDYLIVGAYLYDRDEVPNTGSAYIFKKDTEHNWEQEAFLHGEKNYDALFGLSVDINNNGLAIVGHPGYGNWNRYGRAYIYRRYSTLEWKKEKTLQGGTSTSGSGERFGASVLILNSGKIAVGADQQGVSVPVGPGKVYLFNNSIFESEQNNNWQLTQTIFPPAGIAGDYYGNRIDGNNDLLMVSAWGRNNRKGEVFLYHCKEMEMCTMVKNYQGQNPSDRLGLSIDLHRFTIEESSTQSERKYVGVLMCADKFSGYNPGVGYCRYETLNNNFKTIEQYNLVSPQPQNQEWYGKSSQIAYPYVFIGVPYRDLNGIYDFGGVFMQNLNNKEL